MPRKKIKHVKIQNEKLRNATLKKRIENFYKKAYELATLCSSLIYIIVHDRNDRVSTLWPSQEEFYQGLARFMKAPDVERIKKMVTHEGFMTDLLNDIRQTLQKIRAKNEEEEMKVLLNQMLHSADLSGVDISMLGRLSTHVDQRISKLTDLMGELANQEGQGLAMKNSSFPQSTLHPPIIESVNQGLTSSVAGTPGTKFEEYMWEDEWFVNCLCYEQR